MESSDVFISYRRADVEFTKRVVESLKKKGYEVWVDWEDIPPGVEGFTDEIRRGIEGANAFIAILSPNYLESKYCLMELQEGLKLKKRIIPIVLTKFEGTPAPEGISHINWVYFTPHAGQENKYEQAFPMVIEALTADYAHAREHTRLYGLAKNWKEHQGDASYLLKGGQIDAAERWQVEAVSKIPAPTELHGEFILASRQQQRADQQREYQRQRKILMGIGLLLVIALIAAAIAFVQTGVANSAKDDAVSSFNLASTEKANAVREQQNAENQRATAVAEGERAKAAEAVAEDNRAKAVAAESEARISSLAAQSQLIQSRQLSVLVALEAFNVSKQSGRIGMAVETSLRRALIDFSGVPLYSHDAQASLVRYSPDGKWLLSADASGRVKLSATGGQPIDLLDTGQLGDVFLQAYGSYDSFYSPETQNIIFSPDSHWLAGIYTNALNERSIRVWDLTRSPLSAFDLTFPGLGQGVAVTTIAIGSPKSKSYWLAAGFSDGSLYSWPVADLKAVPKKQFRDEQAQAVTAVAFSSDGRWLAASFGTHNGELWNLATGETPDPMELGNFPIYKLAFSEGGKWLGGISHGYDANGWRDSVKTWNVQAVNNGPKPNILDNKSGGAVYEIAFSPDERWVAIAKSGTAKNLQAYDLQKFSGVPIELPGHRDYVETVDFSPDGRWLASGDYDGNVRLWRTDDLLNNPTADKAQQFNSFDIIVRSVSFSTDSNRLVAAGDNQVRSWDFPVALAEPLKLKQTTLRILTNWLIVQPDATSLLVIPLNQLTLNVAIKSVHKNPLQFFVSPDERYLAITSTKRIEVWDLQNPGTPPFVTERADGQGQFGYVSAASFDPGSRWFAFAVEKFNDIYVIDLQHLNAPARALTGNRKQFNLTDLYFVRDWLVVENGVQLLGWNPTVPDEDQSLTTQDGAFVASHAGDWLAVSENDGAYLWNMQNALSQPVPLGRGTLINGDWYYENLDSQQGNLWNLASGQPELILQEIGWVNSDANVFIYNDSQKNYFALNFHASSTTPIALGNLEAYSISLSPQSNWVIASPSQTDVGAANVSVLFFDLQHGGAQKNLDIPGSSNISFSPDEHWTYFQDANNKWIFYNTQTWEALPDFLQSYSANGEFRFSPDNHWLFVSLGVNGLLVDLTNGAKSYLLQGHRDELTNSLFLLEGGRLATTSFDRTVRLWDLKDPTADPVILAHDASVIAQPILASGRWLITETGDRQIYIWRANFDEVYSLACSLVGRNLTEEEWNKYMGAQKYQSTCK